VYVSFNEAQRHHVTSIAAEAVISDIRCHVVKTVSIAKSE